MRNALTFVLLIATPAAAEPQLLIEITHRGENLDAGVVRPVEMIVTISDGTAGGAVGITGEYTTADVGRTIFADEAMLAAMLAKAAVSSTLVIRNSSPHGLFRSPLDAIWTEPSDAWTTITRFVPRLGTRFTGYNISGISQTIDSIDWETVGGTTPRTGFRAQQTVRIYGEPATVPEPTTWLLACLALCWCRRHR